MTFVFSRSTQNIQDFTTHFNYAKCMNGMMHNIAISLPVNGGAAIDIPKIKKFVKLATLTKNGIVGELKACKDQPEYAEIVAPWIAVKCYYEIYYLESVLVHLAQGSPAVFTNGGHRFVRKTIVRFCEQGYITSKLNEVQIVDTIDSLMAHKIAAGKNLKPDYYLSQDCIKSIRAKLAHYVETQWKISEGIKSYSSSINKAKRNTYTSSRKICLIDFYYEMRLKANYKDMDFLKFSEIPPEQLVEYIGLYSSSARKYCNALRTAIQAIIVARDIKIV